MSDPWEYERKRLENPTYGYQDSGGATSDGRRILTDADALLAVVPFVNEIKEWAETHDELCPGDERDWEAEALDRDHMVSGWLSKAQDILAALPEHLRGNIKERIRK